MLQRDCTCTLGIAIHCGSSICEGAGDLWLNIGKYHLAALGSRVGDSVRIAQYIAKSKFCRGAILQNLDARRLNAIDRNFVAITPSYRVDTCNRLAELCTRLLERESQSGLTFKLYAKVLGCVGCTAETNRQRSNREENL